MLRIVGFAARLLSGLVDGGASRLLHLRGRWRLSRGDAAGAVAALEAAARRAPGAFGPLVALSRAYLRGHDLAGARSALARAREAAPARFTRVVPGVLRAEGFDPAQFVVGAPDPAGSEADPGLVAPLRGLAGEGADARRPATASERAATVVASPGRSAPLVLPLGDCRDLDEYTRFQSMPPISRGEIAAADWDAILDDLADG